MPMRASGLEQVGGMSPVGKGMVGNGDERLQSGKTLRGMSEASHGRLVGPAGDLTRGAMDTHAVAAGHGGVASADVGVSFVKGANAVEQGAVDVVGAQKTPSAEGEDLMSTLSRPITA